MAIDTREKRLSVMDWDNFINESPPLTLSGQPERQHVINSYSGIPFVTVTLAVVSNICFKLIKHPIVFRLRDNKC